MPVKKAKKKSVKKPARKPVKKRRAEAGTSPGAPEHDDPTSVDALLAALDDPTRSLLQSIRSAILGSEKGITEGVKWNNPSFYCRGWFATANVRRRGRGGGNAAGVLVVVHHGAKSPPDASPREHIRDPAGLLQWHGKDRASIALESEADLARKQEPFQQVMAQWVRYHRTLAGPGRS